MYPCTPRSRDMKRSRVGQRHLSRFDHNPTKNIMASTTTLGVWAFIQDAKEDYSPSQMNSSDLSSSVTETTDTPTHNVSPASSHTSWSAASPKNVNDVGEEIPCARRKNRSCSHHIDSPNT